jgi:hypothetical protein
LERALGLSAAEVGAGGGIAATTSFAEFRRGIERHLDIQEHELIPAVEGGETVLTVTPRMGFWPHRRRYVTRVLEGPDGWRLIFPIFAVPTL